MTSQSLWDGKIVHVFGMATSSQFTGSRTGLRRPQELMVRS